MSHHAHVVLGDSNTGVEIALAHVRRELKLKTVANPDVIVMRYSLLAVEDVRKIISLAQQGPLRGDHKVLVVAASRIYHESQNALLKLFEEPPRGTVLYLVIPTIGQLLPTLRSRVSVLESNEQKEESELAKDFLKGTKEKRTELIKKLTSGTDEEERRENRDEALALVNGIEAALHGKKPDAPTMAVLKDIAILRNYLYDRAAPVKLILEHISLVLPKNLGSKSLTTGK